LNRDQKAAVIEEVAGQIRDSEAVFAVDYRGISVPQAADLRTTLRTADATFRVVKNTLTERAADQAGAEGLKELLDGPTAMTFVRGDAAAAAKALRDFRRGTQNTLLEFKGGWMNGAPLTAADMDAIAQLPSRDVLYGRLVGMVASPLTGLAAAMGGLIGGLARQLQAIADQGLVGEGGPAPAAETTPPAGETPDPDADPPATDDETPGPDPDPEPETDTPTEE
jgi:large subunit ribosomal protein L10